MSPRDCHEWHREYDEPGSPLTIRLALVQRRIRDALDAAPPGPIQVVSACAGQGRDVLGVLVDHPRRDDVRARLVELDAGLAETARDAAGDFALSGIDVITGDASTIVLKNLEEIAIDTSPEEPRSHADREEVVRGDGLRRGRLRRTRRGVRRRRHPPACSAAQPVRARHPALHFLPHDTFAG